MKQVNQVEVINNIAHLYIYGEDVCDGWNHLPSLINDFVESENLGPINETHIHYSGILLSDDYINNNGYDGEPDNIGMDYCFDTISNLIFHFNTADMNADELKSFKQCIEQSKGATSYNIVFADPEWSYNY